LNLRTSSPNLHDLQLRSGGEDQHEGGKTLKQYTIRLLEAVRDPEERNRIATKAAAQLGGSTEKLEQLIARKAGSRIARAGTAPHADRVAAILQNAGLSVEVIAPDPTVEEPIEAVDAPTPTAEAAISDPFGPALNRLTPGLHAIESKPDLNSDPFGFPRLASPVAELLEPVDASDPFAAPKLPVRDQVTSLKPVTPDQDPFAPMSNLTGHDPFSAPTAPVLFQSNLKAEPDLALKDDPFAAYGSSSIAAPDAPDDLPPQARKARDRKTRRSSVRSQTLLTLIVPLVMVVAVLVGYLVWALPRQITRLVTNQASVLSTNVASTLYRPMSLRDMSTADSIAWQARADGNASFVLVIDQDATTILGKAVDAGVNRDALDAFWTTDHSRLEIQGGLVQIGGSQYVAAVSPVKDSSGKRIGSVFVGLEGSIVWKELWNVLTPILVVMGLALGLAAAFATGLSARLLRPIFAATDQANRISLGDLDRQIEPTSNDEIGDLLQSLERMRVSLKSMVSRLRRPQENP
jgi:HAMP domain-containing protein